MKSRDTARTELKNSKGEKWILLNKYRKLRNKASGLIRRDNIKANGRRINQPNRIFLLSVQCYKLFLISIQTFQCKCAKVPMNVDNKLISNQINRGWVRMGCLSFG